MATPRGRFALSSSYNTHSTFEYWTRPRHCSNRQTSEGATCDCNVATPLTTLANHRPTSIALFCCKGTTRCLYLCLIRKSTVMTSEIVSRLWRSRSIFECEFERSKAITVFAHSTIWPRCFISNVKSTRSLWDTRFFD